MMRLKVKRHSAYLEIADTGDYRELALEIRRKLALTAGLPIYYAHIGFTGSSSLSSALHTVVPYFSSDLTGDPRLEGLPPMLEWTPDLLPRIGDWFRKHTTGARVVSMHSWPPPKLDFIYGQRPPLIQMLRDPLKFYASNYFWSKKMVDSNGAAGATDELQAHIASGWTFEDFVREWVPRNDNRMSRLVAILALDLRDFDRMQSLIDHAFAISPTEVSALAESYLDSCCLVALADQMSEALFILLTAMGERRLPLWTTVGASGAPRADSFSPDIRETIRRHSEVDAYLFAKCTRRFDALFGKEAELFRAQIKSLRSN